MKYLVDIVATVRISGVMIDVDSFDEKVMARAAADKFSGAVRYDVVNDMDVEDSYLMNWNSLD